VGVVCIDAEVFVRFIDKIGPELLFIIGILVIVAYVVVKAIPMIKELQIKAIDAKHEIEMRTLDQNEEREKRKQVELEKNIEAERSQIQVMTTQNDLLRSISTSNDAMTTQMAILNKYITDSNHEIEEVSDTVESTNRMVSDIHKLVVKKGRPLNDTSRD